MRLETVIKKLKVNKIPFYITGSYAVELYTGLRIPSDVDIVMRSADMERLPSIFKDIKKVYRNIKGMKFHTYEIDNYEFGSFEIFNCGIDFKVTDDRLERCNRKKIGNYFCDIIPVEDLIELKLILFRNGGSKADSEDIKLLLRTNHYSFLRLFFTTIRHRTIFRFMNMYRKRHDDGLDRLQAFRQSTN